MKIAFVAVNYNNCWITTNYVSNIKAIHGYEKHDVEIVIVDNASQENDYKSLKKQIEKEQDVRLVHSDKNLGYFGGLNFGIKILNYKDYDYIIAGNNDLFFSRDFFEILEKKKYGNKQTVIVPDLETISGVHQNPQFIDVPSAKRQLGYKVYYELQFKIGYCSIQKSMMRELFRPYMADENFAYERRPIQKDEENDIAENPYHGNLLLKKDASKALKKNIQCGLATLAAGSLKKREE